MALKIVAPRRIQGFAGRGSTFVPAALQPSAAAVARAVNARPRSSSPAPPAPYKPAPVGHVSNSPWAPLRAAVAGHVLAHQPAPTAIVRQGPLPSAPAGYRPPGVQGVAGRGGVTYAPAGLRSNVNAAATAAVAAGAKHAGKSNPAAVGATGGSSMLQSLLKRYIASLQTPQQQQAQIDASAQGQIQDELSGYREIYNQTKADQVQAAQRAQGFALAMNALQPQMQAQTQAVYNDAAQNLQGLGTGLTGAVQDAQQAQANQTAASVAGLTGGLGQTGGYDPAALRSIAQFTGVVQPSSDLYREAATQGAASALRQRAAAGQVENIGQGYLQQGEQDRQDYLAKVADTLAKKPGLIAQMQQAQSGNQRQDMATIIQGLGLENQQANTQSQIADRTFQQSIDDMNSHYKGLETYYKGLDTSIKNFVAQANAKHQTVTGQAATTTAKATATRAAVDQAKITGTLPGHPDMLAPNFHWTDASHTATATYDPKTQQIDPRDPTRVAVIPRGGNPITSALDPGFHWSTSNFNTRSPQPYDSKHFQLDPNDPNGVKLVRLPDAPKTKKPPVGYTANGKIDPNYYPNPLNGGKLEKIPSGFVRDTTSKTGLRDLTPPVVKPKPGYTVSGALDPRYYINPYTGKPTRIPGGFVPDPSSKTGLRDLTPPNKPTQSSQASIQRAIASFGKDASKGALSPTFVKLQNPNYKAYQQQPIYVPKMSLAQALPKLLTAYYGTYSNNPFARANATAILQGLGFK